MRIIGHIEHPSMKITVFKMDNKLSVKFETGLYEQTYKFRESETLQDFTAMKKLVDAAFCAAVLAQFGAMHQMKNQAMERFLPAGVGEEFEEII